MKCNDMHICDNAHIGCGDCRRVTDRNDNFVRIRPIEHWVIMIDGKIFTGGNHVLYDTEKQAMNYTDRYCMHDCTCEVIKIGEIE